MGQVFISHAIRDRRPGAEPRAFVHALGSTSAVVCQRNGGVWEPQYGINVDTKRRIALPRNFELSSEARDALDAVVIEGEE